jgi:alpha-N-arabinofuranosidase
MYANLLEPRVGKTDVEAGWLIHGNQAVPVLDAVATVDGTGNSWSIAMVNRHPTKEVTCRVAMLDRPLDGQFEATILAGDSPDAFNDIEHPDRVVPERKRITFNGGATSLPPHSLTIFRITN